jgi:hypothetical protein
VTLQHAFDGMLHRSKLKLAEFHRSIKRRFYVFCRFWPGFTAQFPFEEFNHLPEDQILPAACNAVERRLNAEPEWRMAQK